MKDQKSEAKASDTQSSLKEELKKANELELTNVYDLTPLTEEQEESNHFLESAQSTPQQPPKPPRKPAKRKPIEQEQQRNIFGEDKTIIEEEEAAEVVENSGGSNFLTDAGQMTLNSIIPAEVLTTIIDKGLSILLPLALNNLAGTKLKPKDFKLSAEERKTMKPAIERAAQTIKINLNNPWVALAFTATAVYGAKAVEKVNFDDIDADDLGASEVRIRKPKGEKRERDYAAEYARRKAREEGRA